MNPLLNNKRAGTVYTPKDGGPARTLVTMSIRAVAFTDEIGDLHVVPRAEWFAWASKAKKERPAESVER